MSTDVAIIGVGLHPFGRFGDKIALEMGADAIMLALQDAGIEWKDVGVGFGGSFEVGNPDAVKTAVPSKPVAVASTRLLPEPDRVPRINGADA